MASGLPSTSLVFFAVRFQADPSRFLYGHCLSCHLCGCSGCWVPLWALLELPALRLLRLLGSFMGTALRLLRLLAISCLRRLPRAHPGRLPRAHPSPKKERLWLAGPAWPAHTPITSHPHHPPLFTLSAESAEITTAPSHHPHVTTRPIITHAHITLATTHTQLTTISIKIQTNHSVGFWLRLRPSSEFGAMSKERRRESCK